MKPPPPGEAYWTAGVFLLVLAVYVSALCPGAYWLDSSEFAAASFVLGVAHPPGHPLALLVGKAAALLPFGPIAFRVGLGQALCGAAAAALLGLIGARVAARAWQALPGAREERPAHPQALFLCVGAAAALCTSLGYAAGFQAVRPEVYALHRLLALLSLHSLLRYDETGAERELGLGVFFLGLGLANHHFLALLSALPVPLLFLRQRRRLGRLLGVCFAAGAIGLLFYAYLPLRAAHHPLVNWGSPTTPGRLLWTISARAFQKSVKPPAAGDEDVLGALFEALHPLGVLLVLAGLYLLLRQRPTRLFGLYLLALAALGAGGRAVLGFDVANPDAFGYLVPAIDALALCACAGLGALLYLCARGRRRRSLATALAVLAVVGGTAWGALAYPRLDRSRFFDLDVLVGGWLREAPPRALLLSSYFQTVFGLWYLQGVEGQRPDVLHLHPHFLPNPGYREDVLHRDPDLPPQLLGEKGVRLGPLLELGRQRPVVLEFDLDTGAEFLPHLVPHGLGEALEERPDPQRFLSRMTQSEDRRDAVLGELDRGEPETRRNLLWRSFLGLHLSCGTPPRFQRELQRARVLLGGIKSPEIEELVRRCDIGGVQPGP